VALAVVGLCLFIVGAYFGSHYSGKRNEASIIYRKALDDERSILMRMAGTEDSLTADSSETYQSLAREYDQLVELATNNVELRNNLGSTANRYFLLSCFGACIALVPILFLLLRLPSKILNYAQVRK
jgi:VIT1/CCC1 family predicted Fe2+/Mn2+ transporter